VYVCNETRRLGNAEFNDIDFCVSSYIFASFMLYVSMRYDESMKYASLAMNMILEYKLTKVVKRSEQHRNLVLVLSIAFIIFSANKMV